MDQNVIKAAVNQRRIKVGEYVPPTAGNKKRDFLEVTLDSEWNEDSLRVAFFRESLPRPLEVEWDGDALIEIPWEVTADAGSFGFTVVGTTDGIDRIITVMPSPSERVRVRLNGEDDGVEPSEASEDILVSAIKATDRANEVSERVETSEAERVATFNANQLERDTAFTAAQVERANAFTNAQTERSEQFTSDQQSRSNAFNADMATWAQDVAQKVAEAATAAQAANNAANNISQRADSGEFNGAPFSISYTPVSIAAMNAIQGAKQGEFAVINSNVEDPDNAKLFMFGNGTWNLMSDLSGATGFGLQGKQGVSLKGVRVINQTQVEVTQYDPMTEQERTYVIGDFAAPLAAGVSGYVDSKWQVVDAMPENPVPGVIYFVRE